MKIVIATAVYHPMINGVAVFSHNLAKGLAQRGNDVLVLCPSQTGKSYSKVVDGVRVKYLRSVEAKIYPDQIHSVPEQKKIFGVRMPRLLYKHGFRVSIFPQGEVKKVLDRFLPDVVHVQVSDPIGLSVVSYARKHHIPVVTTEHNQPEVLTDPLKVPGIVKKPANALLSSYFRNRQSKSDFVTMPTEQAIRHLLSHGKELNIPIAAVSSGVDLSNFKPGNADAEIYKKYKIPKNKLIILYVGRVDPEKKVDLVIEAFLKMSEKMPEVELVVVGDGVAKNGLIKKYDDNEKIHFLGRVVEDDLYEVYKVGAIFATASEIETQGLVLIEAAATGLPLIAVDKGAVSEVCRNGENGVLCRSGNIDDLSKAMTKLLSNKDLREKYGKKSIEIASLHDFERTLDKFENIYRKVIGLPVD